MKMNKSSIKNNTDPFLEEKFEGEANHRGLKLILSLSFTLMFIWSLVLFIPFVGLTFGLGKIYGDISFLYTISPVIFLILIPLSLLSVYLFYMIFKVRTMTRNAWTKAMAFPFFVIVAAAITFISFKDYSNKLNQIGIGSLESTPLGAAINILIFFALIFIPVLALLILTSKRFNKPSLNLSRVPKKIVTIFSILILGFSIVYIANAAVGVNEKPFTGASKVKKKFGSVVSFSYIPSTITHSGTMVVKNGKGSDSYGIVYSNPKNAADLDNFLIIIEGKEKSAGINKSKKEIRNGQTYYYYSDGADGNKHNILYFSKNGLEISISASNDKVITKEELYKIAESAK